MDRPTNFTVTPEGHFRLTGVLPDVELKPGYVADHSYLTVGEWFFDEETSEEALEGTLAYLALYNHLSNIRTSPVKLDNE